MKNRILFSLLALTGCPADPVEGPPGGGGGGDAWQAIGTIADDQRVTAIQCETPAICVVATDGDDPGKLLALADGRIGATLVDGADVAEPAHVLGDIGFLGLRWNGPDLVARLDVSGAYVVGSGNVMAADSWSVTPLGTVDGDAFNFLNAQEALVGAGDEWILVNRAGAVFRADAAPAPGTVWTRLWSPTAADPVPADFPERLAADPTLCDADVSTRISPPSTQTIHASNDGGLIVLTAGGINQDGSAAPGVCVSTDHGETFYSVPFTDLPDVNDPGPLAVTCIDGDRCWAYNGLQAQSGSFYVYYTTNASMAKASTWTRATVPAALASDDGVQPKAMFFAPDGQHGWIVGDHDGGPLLVATVDGGKTWTDASGSLAGVTEVRLHSGFALSATQVWLGGERGTLLVAK
jgi:hypothetical protein